MNTAETYEILENKVNNNITKIKITKPDGKSVFIEPFVYTYISADYNEEGYEKITSDGKCELRYRYSPDISGEYTVYEMCGDSVVSEYKFNAEQSGRHGYVKVSGKNNKYFAYSDETPFLPIGINMAFPKKYQLNDSKEFGLSDEYCYIGLRQYEAWFKKASAAGANVVRIWCGHDYFAPERGNADKYVYEQFAKLDKIFEFAHKYGIKLKITMDQFRYFKYDEKGSYMEELFAKELYSGERKCMSVSEWLTDSFWQDKWLDKVNEYAKRYAYDDALFAVELWNEMNSIGCEWDRCNPQIAEWNKKMSGEVKKMFPIHMVVNSLGSYASDISQEHYEKFCWNRFDFKQIHSYLDQGADYKEMRENPIEMLKRACSEQATDTQPLFVAETGAVNNNHSGPFRFYSSDDDGLIFADCVYTPLFLGCAGCGNIWHWDDRYIEFKNLYHMYKPFVELTHDINFIEERFEVKDYSNEYAYIQALEGQNHSLYYIRNKSANWKNVLRDLNEPTVIDMLELQVDGTAESVHIWNDAGTLEQNGNTAIIRNIKNGVFVKVSR